MNLDIQVYAEGRSVTYVYVGLFAIIYCNRRKKSVAAHYEYVNISTIQVLQNTSSTIYRYISMNITKTCMCSCEWLYVSF